MVNCLYVTSSRQRELERNTFEPGRPGQEGLKTHPATTRIEGYDLARALAIFGMVVVNFKIVMTLGSDTPPVPEWLRVLTGLLEGRAAALFVVLAGIGMSLGARSALASGDAARRAAVRGTLWKRAVFLFVGGLLFASVWPADILHFYGWYIGIGALFIFASNRTLLATAAFLVLAFVGLLAIFDYEAGWHMDTLTYEGFWTPEGQVRHLLFNGFHPVVPWLAFLLTGIWLGRRDLGASAVRRRILFGAAAIALAAEAVSAALIALLSRGASGEAAGEIAALAGTAAMPPMPLYMLAAGGTAVAVIALAVGFSQRFSHVPGHRALVATGRLALTVYVAHVLLGMGVLEAFGRLEDQTLSFAVAASVAFYAAAVAFAVVWTKRFDRGPLEWVMRRLAG